MWDRIESRFTSFLHGIRVILLVASGKDLLWANRMLALSSGSWERGLGPGLGIWINTAYEQPSGIRVFSETKQESEATITRRFVWTSQGRWGTYKWPYVQEKANNQIHVCSQSERLSVLSRNIYCVVCHTKETTRGSVESPEKLSFVLSSHQGQHRRSDVNGCLVLAHSQVDWDTLLATMSYDPWLGRMLSADPKSHQ